MGQHPFPRHSAMAFPVTMLRNILTLVFCFFATVTGATAQDNATLSDINSVVVSNSIGHLNNIEISDMSGTIPAIGALITVWASDVNGKMLPESESVVPLTLYNHGTTRISGLELMARFPSGQPMMYRFSINSPNVVMTNVKNSMNDIYKVPTVYLNGTNVASNFIANCDNNTINISDLSGLTTDGSVIGVKAWDKNGNALVESRSAAPLKLYDRGTSSISGSSLAARFPDGSPLLYEFIVPSVKEISTLKNNNGGNLNIPFSYIRGVRNFVSNSTGDYNTLEISDLSGALPFGGGTISVEAWDTNGKALAASGSAVPLTLYNHGTTSISGLELAARFTGGKPITYEFSIESSKVLITNVKKSMDDLVEIPSIFTTGISNYTTNYVSSFTTIKISDTSYALPAGGVSIGINAWDANGNAVPESGGAAPLKLRNFATTIISGSDLAARFPSGFPVLYEFAINSPNAIVTCLTSSADMVIKVPNVFTIGGFGGI